MAFGVTPPETCFSASTPAQSRNWLDHLSWERLRRDAASNLKARCGIQHHPVWLSRDVDRAREAKFHAPDEFAGAEFPLHRLFGCPPATSRRQSATSRRPSSAFRP